MRQLSWQVFSMTGNVESYLLFKELDRDRVDEASEEEEENPLKDHDSIVH
ncbi:YqzL family protein [Salipaludibacillus keqinensis]|uniref:YqzL family protein n=1 Tax=Salipaludibacillus keqinensis TaxID=2045207 RepID=A0A323TKP4_9BACI|nr:YqzL family protein [Salipaludibacillus keqinensis]PYZ94257.1 YqzL family protein [Salipaludibacillus keqinensis]